MNTEYTDLYDNQTNLSETELQWFRSICAECINATGIKITIENDNHYGKYKGKSREALGIFSTNNKENPLSGECKITIDNYFIHECYEEIYNGKHNLNFETIEHVIAHELAHAYQWRHCKRHERITENFYNQIKKYQKQRRDIA